MDTRLGCAWTATMFAALLSACQPEAPPVPSASQPVISSQVPRVETPFRGALAPPTHPLTQANIPDAGLRWAPDGGAPPPSPSIVPIFPIIPVLPLGWSPPPRI